MYIRLDRLLAGAGEGSRRDVSACIRAGKVSVNGRVITNAEYKLDPEQSVVELDGRTVVWKRFCHVMYYKPPGVLSATRDDRAPTALDMLPPIYTKQKLAPAGRLDKDAEGLLLLTNDGQLAHKIISPRSHIDKTYIVRLARPANEDYARAFASGVVLEDGTLCLPGALVILNENTCEVTIHEGKYHQVKRMFTSLGNEVIHLKRIKIGTLMLDKQLKPGEYRELNNNETAELIRLTGENNK